MKKIIILALFFFNILFALPSNAENFYIKNYDITLEVNEHKAVFAKESMDVFFTVPSHGIYRTIPIKRGGKIGRVWASGYYDGDFTNTSTKIKIGNPNRYVQGDKHYNIEYDYYIQDGKNEFYFNIIGTQWNTDILNSTFTVIMPKAVDADKVGLSIGKKGTKGFKDIATYSVNGNVITGKMLQPLPPNNGITIRIEVPDDYFIQDGVAKINKYAKQFTIFLMIICAYISFMIWFIYGRDKHITPVVSFYPPKDLNSAQVGIIYDEQVNTKHVVSLIYYLATKGYIKIINDKDYFQIVQIKEYDGNNADESKLMSSLFSAKNKSETVTMSINDFFNAVKDYAKNSDNPTYETSDANTVTELELKYSRNFYKDIQEIESNINKFRNKIFNLSSLGFGKNCIMIVSLIVVCLLLVYALSGYTFRFFTEGFIFGLFPIIGIFVLASVLPRAPLAVKIFILFWGAGFIGIPCFMFLDSGIISFEETPVLLLGLGCALVIGICWQNLPQWTEHARTLRGEILGFRKFLQVAEQSRIEQLMKDNPDYCTDLLPYAYVLGVTDTWMKKIETLIANPVWYSGEFNHHSFSHISSNLATYSSPSTSNGGCSSSSSGGGAGCSGGGHGGGGGGSW